MVPRHAQFDEVVPPPRRHLVRYAGVFGPASRARKQLRALVLEAAPATTANPRCPAPGPPASSRRRRLPWADLLRRVFAQDVLACPCGGRRTVTAFVVDTTLARSVLTALGLAVVEPASFAPARDPPQAAFAWDDPA